MKYYTLVNGNGEILLQEEGKAAITDNLEVTEKILQVFRLLLPNEFMENIKIGEIEVTKIIEPSEVETHESN